MFVSFKSIEQVGMSYMSVIFIFTVVFVLGTVDPVFAYGGPGSVISGIGAFLAAVVAILASLLGFIWFPLKRLYRSITEEETPSEEPSAEQTGK